MTSEEKETIYARLLAELKAGKSEEEVKKEFYEAFPEQNPWNQSKEEDKGSSSETPNTNYLEENPLVVFAEENGALRALMKNIRIDMESKDEVAKRMLLDELNRFGEIAIHYQKKEELLFPLLEKYSVDALEERKKEDDEVLLLQKQNLASLKEGKIDKDRLHQLLQLTEKEITDENHFLLPILDEKMTEEELLALTLASDNIGYCLIRHPNKK